MVYDKLHKAAGLTDTSARKRRGVNADSNISMDRPMLPTLSHPHPPTPESPESSHQSV